MFGTYDQQIKMDHSSEVYLRKNCHGIVDICNLYMSMLYFQFPYVGDDILFGSRF